MLLPLVLALAIPPVYPINPSTPTSIKGVPPSKAHLYIAPASNAQWKCLDGSKAIPWSSVNDDYCDCDDGSDEPGTSACPNGTFHCVNPGHIGSDIRSSRVGDGLCEPECCDGSDEAEGVCPNRCEAIGAVHRAEQEAIMKSRRTGAKIRSSYIAFAKKEKTRLEGLIAELKKEVTEKTAKQAAAQDLLDRVEALDKVALEVKKQSPLYLSLQKHNAAIKALDARAKRFQATITQMETLLDGLESGYNPNYVDMAVIDTVKAWKKFKGEDDKDQEKEGDSEKEGEKKEEVDETDEEKEDVKWSDWEVKQLSEHIDYVTLLLDHERHVSQGLGGEKVKSLLFSVEDYIPEGLLPSFEYAKTVVVDTLASLGVVPKAIDTSAETAAARKAHTDATSALSTVENNLRKEETALSKLFNPEWFGKHGEWRKLEDQCISKDTGEYTYTVCMFSGATQKSNKDGASNNLGSFTSWSKSTEAVPGEYDYYTKQYYENGAHCWNGPQRSVTLKLSCGTENELLTVSEPEKCEYHITGRSPALCWPLEMEGGADIHKREL